MAYTFLRTICADTELESTWLDLLSQLEYVGCRKILKSVDYQKVDAQILRHIQEEALHAFLLKDLAQKRRGEVSLWTQNPWSEIGWRYIQGVDHAISRHADDKGAYPLVSWGIEQRVLELYPFYLKATSDPDVKRVIKTILAQEKRHSLHFDLFSADLQHIAAACESALWFHFEEELEKALADENCLPPRTAVRPGVISSYT